jgi:SSS family solute:Na+ symporter
LTHSLDPSQLAGFAVVLLLVVLLGTAAARMVHSSSDFTVGSHRAGWPLVAGAIVGTLVAGSSTLGTAQLAYTSGLDAWWVTLGAGAAALILGLLSRRLNSRYLETVPQLLGETYGPRIVPLTSIFSSLAIFLSIIGQGLSGVALLTSLLPVGTLTAALLCLALVLAYVFFGGVYGTGLIGQVKLVLLLLAFGAAGALSFILVGGWPGLQASLPTEPWLSLFGRGVGKDLAVGLSLVVGVLSTQTYLQAMFAARNWRAARTGSLVAAIATPILGLGGVLVGLYMRVYFPGLPSASVLPVFMLEHFPPFLAGMALATLLVTVVSGWAGLTLGVATMIGKDIFKRFLYPRANDRSVLWVERLIILGISALAAILVVKASDSMIVDWYVLSLSLRGTTVLLPLLGALFLPRWVHPGAGVLAALLGPLVVILWSWVDPAGIDPLYPGLALSTAILLGGGLLGRTLRK